MKILAICGSLLEKSGNLTLLKCAMAGAPAGVEVVLFDGIRELPHFNPDLESNGELPVVAAWRCALRTSAAVFIASPEYGFSLPGALKNAIDWVIGTGELEGKFIAITAAVPGPERGRRGLGALRDTLNAVSAKIVGGEPIARGPSFEGAVLELLTALVAKANET